MQYQTFQTTTYNSFTKEEELKVGEPLIFEEKPCGFHFLYFRPDEGHCARISYTPPVLKNSHIIDLPPKMGSQWSTPPFTFFTPPLFLLLLLLLMLGHYANKEVAHKTLDSHLQRPINRVEGI